MNITADHITNLQTEECEDYFTLIIDLVLRDKSTVGIEVPVKLLLDYD